jgi:ABC-type antimicrobial peptide transport system permease subunit
VGCVEELAEWSRWDGECRIDGSVPALLSMAILFATGRHHQNYSVKHFLAVFADHYVSNTCCRIRIILEAIQNLVLPLTYLSNLKMSKYHFQALKSRS